MSYWETAEERNPAAPQYALEFARIWKDLPKIVYSNTLTRVEGKTRLSSEDPVAEVPRLKEQPGEPLGVGGATLALTTSGSHCLRTEWRIGTRPAPTSSSRARRTLPRSRRRRRRASRRELSATNSLTAAGANSSAGETATAPRSGPPDLRDLDGDGRGGGVGDRDPDLGLGGHRRLDGAGVLHEHAQ
mgnify:CR=1 FL=1